MLLEFKHPEFLWLILLPVAFCAWSLVHHRQSRLEYSWLRLVLGPLALGFCLLGLARPQLGHRVTETRAASSNLFIAMDISRSMLAEDVSPNRLRFSIAFAQRLLPRIEGSRVALYPFSGDGYIQLPLTADTVAVADMLTTMDPSMTSDQGSDLSQSMDTLMENIVRMEDKAVARGASWAAPQVLLFSDGESHGTIRPQVFEKFRRKGIPIFTVGVGTEEGGPLRLTNAFGGLEPLRNNGRIVHSKLDSRSLRRISEITGGSYFRSSFSEILPLSRRLRQSLQFGRLSTQFKAERELFPLIFTLGVILFCCELLLGRWQFVLRVAIGWLIFTAVPAHAQPSKAEEKIRAIQLYNEALDTLDSGGNLDKAAEKFQESAFLTRDPALKKKALLALGNTMLKLQDPEQALAIYQEARDSVASDGSFNKEANNRISDNMVLARRVQQQMMQQQAKDPNQKGKGKEQEPDDRRGPKKDYQAQQFTDQQKQKIFDLIASEEQEILKKLRQRKQRRNPRRAKGKPW